MIRNRTDMVNKALWLTVLACALLSLSPCQAFDRDAAEAARIQYLIKAVEGLKGVKFIRNGSEYGSRRAAEHLRLKLDKAGPRVKTAEDFISLIGSGSSLSGRPYLLLFPDGRTMDSETFFREQLKFFVP